MADGTAVEASIYQDGTADARVNPQQADQLVNGLFRKRYRKLSAEEMKVHDLIKDQAEDLARTIGALNPEVYQRLTGVALPRDPSVAVCDPAQVTLALRHLEDAVYRAVKAVTA